MSKVTLKDIAREANVSVGLTSKALTGYHEVSAATQRRIRRISRQLGYRPPTRRGVNEAPKAGQHFMSPVRRAGLAFLNNKNSAAAHTQQWMRAFSQASREHDIRLDMTLLDPRQHDQTWEAELRRFAEDVDGLLLFGFVRAGAREVIASLGKHCVAIGDFEPGPVPVEHQVSSDKREMAYMGTQALLKVGHRRIGLVAKTCTPGSWNEQWRLGFRMALMEAEVHDDPSLRPALEFDDRWSCAQIAAKHFVAMEEQPTAYVLPEIGMAVHFRNAMTQHGMNLTPGQMVLGGDPDNAIHSGLGGYPLISEDVSAAAMHAVDLLHRLARDEVVPPIRALVSSQVHHFNQLDRRDISCSSQHDSDISANTRKLALRRSR